MSDERVDGAGLRPAESVAGGGGKPSRVPASDERVDGAGLRPAESVAGGGGKPSRVPASDERVDGAGLRPAESVAGGGGNPSRVPASDEREELRQLVGQFRTHLAMRGRSGLLGVATKGTARPLAGAEPSAPAAVT